MQSNPIASSTDTPLSSPKSKARAGFAGGDFETFLKMLTAQIKNQDPLNPMEGSDFAVQLATFSGVEQQVQTNGLLQKIVGSTDQHSLSPYTGWIGKLVRTTGEVYFNGESLNIEFNPSPAADKTQLVITDNFGRIVSTNDIILNNSLTNSDGVASVNWDGRGADGTPLPNGVYNFTVRSYKGDKLVNVGEAATYSTVYGVQKNDDKIAVILSGGAIAQLNQINAIGIDSRPPVSSGTF